MENLTVRRTQAPSWTGANGLGLALVVGVFVLAAALSWRRWPDMLVDFGTQLYLPWRIAEGDVLYRDVNYLTGGPLSQYFHALLFKVFGVSFRTLLFSNLIITAGILVLIYRRFLAVADRLTATMVCLGIILVFVFQHCMLIGNYNYVTPYCHEIFHGLMLAMVAVMWLSDWVETKRIKFAAAAGFGSGLVFLTKPEVFLAVLLCVLAAAAMAGSVHRQVVWLVKSLAAFLLAGLAPLLIFFAVFLRVENWRASLFAVVSAWAPLWHASIVRDPFYQWCLGLDMPFSHLEKMVVQFIVVAGITTIYALIFRHGVESRFKWMGFFRMARPLLALPLLIMAAGWDWVDCGRTLPLLMLVAGGLLVLDCRKTVVASAPVFPLLWTVLSLGLLLKLGIFPRIWHYGFALAMPAFAGAVYLFVWLLPLRLERRYQVRARLFRTVVSLVLAVGMVRLFLHSESFYLHKNISVGSNGDRILAYDSGMDPFHGRVETALYWMETNAPSRATLAVLPEGAMINYLSRRANPTPFLAWVPPVMAVFGETNMTATFKKNSPDYVVIIARSATEFGVGFFGYDPRYGADLKHWIDEHYDQVYPEASAREKGTAEKPPFYGLQIWKRRATDPPGGKL